MSKGTEQEGRLPARITGARKVREMTQQQLADAAGLSRQALALMEAGKKRMRVSDIIDLAHALDVPVSDLLSAEPMEIRLSIRIPD